MPAPEFDRIHRSKRIHKQLKSGPNQADGKNHLCHVTGIDHLGRSFIIHIRSGDSRLRFFTECLKIFL